MENKKIGSPKGPRPQCWKTGPDPDLHRRYRCWIQQKNQAQFRDESWDLPFDVWCEIWGQLFEQKGRDKHSLCMTRIDLALPWHKDNVKIVTRSEHFRSNRNKQGQFATRGN